MRILCLIDQLGAGGAQRQLVTLAIGLKRRGHAIRFLAYHPDGPLMAHLQRAGVECHVIASCSAARRAWSVRRVLRQAWQDVVLAFLPMPSFYAEVARLPTARWGLVVGERSANPHMNAGYAQWIRHCHRLADAIVCNSHTNRMMLNAAYPFVTPKSCVIYNMIDREEFRLAEGEDARASRAGAAMRIVVAASYQPNKNMTNVARAAAQLKREGYEKRLIIDWFGGLRQDRNALYAARSIVEEHGLHAILRFHGETAHIADAYASADAVALFSFYEGLPNVICEGMACGKPILMSDVCDAGSLVREGHNGFLCSPSSPVEIAGIIRRMIEMPRDVRREMGRQSGRIADTLFAEDVIVACYERVLAAAARHTAPPPGCNWPQQAPTSAFRTVDKWQGQDRGARKGMKLRRPQMTDSGGVR